MTRKRCGDRFLIWIGPPEDFCSSLSGAISSTAVSSSPRALTPLTRDLSFVSVSSSSSGVKPTITATPKRNSATMPCPPDAEGERQRSDHVRTLEPRRVDALADNERPRGQTRRDGRDGKSSLISVKYAPARGDASGRRAAAAVRGRTRSLFDRPSSGKVPDAFNAPSKPALANAFGRATMEDASKARWRLDGVRVVHSNELDINTPQTPGMNRAAAITHARAGAEKLWAGTVVIHPKAKTGAHHHGPVESVIYVVSGRARMRWGDRLEFVAEAGPGDFIYVPPFVPHQEINASDDDPLSCVLVRSGQEPVVVNLDLPNVEPNPEPVEWVDDLDFLGRGGRLSVL